MISSYRHRPSHVLLQDAASEGLAEGTEAAAAMILVGRQFAIRLARGRL
eukprot:CAMPEP_0172177438 /NCGR_PEP_ID=MMETSP1050-20130122/15436_1 /TAXON_ID=233186 /ORGANISM="Cryptomonas curvata, Strain CCAP979/52" /LENGTH=48 /DNA_ID= /DNA_START= /DNA_END= /DNA_ORIENTATION=